MPAGAITPLNVAVRITTTGVTKAASGMRAVTGASHGMARGLGSGVIGARTLGDSMRMTASLIKYSVVGVFINAGKQAIQLSRQFELSFSRIRGLVVVTGNTLDQMKEKVLSLAGETTRAPIELANALYYITSAGIKDSVVALEVLEVAAKAAAAGLGTTETVADAVTSTMNAYGVGQMSAARATDVLVATVREGKAEADTFAPALGKVLPVAAAYGASFEDVSAAIAALSRGGLSAGTSAIYVRQTLSQLMKPSKAATEVLKGVGLSAESIRDKVQNEGLFPALMMLRDRLGGIENMGDFTKVFGNVRALTAVLSLVGPAADENAQIFERLNNSAGDLDHAFQSYAETLDADFNKRAAEGQRALIELGNALKPLVSFMLKAGTILAKVFSKIFGNKVGGYFLKITAAVVVLIAVLATMLKTMSAFVRLGSNMSIMLSGQQLQYGTLTKTIMTYTQAQSAAAAAAGAATGTTTALTVATGFLAKATLFAATAMSRLMMVMGPLMILASMVAIFGPMLFNLFKGGQYKGINEVATGLSKVNELLNETAKYAASGITFKMDVDVESASEQIVFEKLREGLEAESPGFIDKVTAMGKEDGMAYVNAVVQTKFGGNTSKFKTNFLEFFQKELGAEGMKLNPTIFRTGVAAVDAAMEAALISAQQRTVRGNNKIDLSKLEIDAPTIDIATELATADSGRAKASGSANAKAYGNAFTDGIQQTGGLAPLIESAAVLSKALDGDALKQNVLVSGIFEGALSGLSEKFDIAGEKGGNLAKIFSETKNVSGLEKLIQGTFQENDAAVVTAIMTEIQTAMKGVGHDSDSAGEAFTKFMEVYSKHKAVAEAATKANKGLDDSLTAIEDRFTNGLSPAVQEAADAFAAANAAIDQFKRGQEALMGLTRTGIEVQIAYRESLRGFAEDASKAGGNLFANTEGADKAKSGLLDAIDGVLDVANNFAAGGETEKATNAIGEGMAQIMAAGVAQGLKPEDIQKFFDMNNFNEAIVSTFAGAGDDINPETSEIGGQLVAGLAAGIENGQPFVDAAIGNLSKDVIAKLKAALLISSPSKKVADEVGKPTAQGFAMGFQKEMAGNSGKSIGKSLNEAVQKSYKDGGRKGANTFFEKFLEKKGKVEDPAGDFVKESIGRMKDIVGALGDYIKSQLDFRKAKADLVKLINMQRGLDDRKKKAARDTQFAGTRFGGNGGAEVTGYEQSNIDKLQMDFEKASRSFSMGRISYAELIDSEIALFEARAAASEVNDEVLSAQNAFVDASVNVENKELDLANATVGVMSAFQGQQEAAANLYTFHKELGKVYGDLAAATGLASGKLVIGTTDLLNLGEQAGKLGGFISTVGDFTSTLGGKVITTKTAFDKDFFGDGGVFANIVKATGDVNTLTKSIGADFTNLSRGLLDPESEMYKNLASLGPSIFKAIQTSAQNKLDQSPLNLNIRVGATVNGKSGGSKLQIDIDPLGGNPPADTSGAVNTVSDAGPEGRRFSTYVVPPKTVVNTPAPKPTKTSLVPKPSVAPKTVTIPPKKINPTGKAVGGPVATMQPYMVGEKGPEMFVPKVSGTIVTSSALDRYTRVREKSGDQAPSGASNISVTVNNPVPQAAEDSITRRMKVLANSGMFG